MLRALTVQGLRVKYLPEVLVNMQAGGASNGSLRGLLQKSREDYRALRKNRVGGWYSLLAKNLRKSGQFFQRRKAPPPGLDYDYKVFFYSLATYLTTYGTWPSLS